MPVVYITAASEMRYAKARAFGDIHVIITNRLAPTYRLEQLELYIQYQLRVYQPGTDRLLIGGSSIVDILAAGFLFAQSGYVDILQWDADLNDFVSHRLTFEPVSELVQRSSDATRMGEENSRDLS